MVFWRGKVNAEQPSDELAAELEARRRLYDSGIERNDNTIAPRKQQILSDQALLDKAHANFKRNNRQFGHEV